MASVNHPPPLPPPTHTHTHFLPAQCELLFNGSTINDLELQLTQACQYEQTREVLEESSHYCSTTVIISLVTLYWLAALSYHAASLFEASCICVSNVSQCSTYLNGIIVILSQEVGTFGMYMENDPPPLPSSRSPQKTVISGRVC